MMTTSRALESMIAAADLADPADRLVLADALMEAGRTEEESLLRDQGEAVGRVGLAGPRIVGLSALHGLCAVQAEAAADQWRAAGGVRPEGVGLLDEDDFLGGLSLGQAVEAFASVPEDDCPLGEEEDAEWFGGAVARARLLRTARADLEAGEPLQDREAEALCEDGVLGGLPRAEDEFDGDRIRYCSGDGSYWAREEGRRGLWRRCDSLRDALDLAGVEYRTLDDLWWSERHYEGVRAERANGVVAVSDGCYTWYVEEEYFDAAVEELEGRAWHPRHAEIYQALCDACPGEEGAGKLRDRYLGEDEEAGE